MKALLIAAITVISISAMAKTTPPETKAQKQAKICEALQEKADEDCVSLMCDDGIADGTWQDEAECTSADDYAEAAQGACEDTLSDRVAEYNAAHKTAKVKCEE
jgi:hypothetical protein